MKKVFKLEKLPPTACRPDCEKTELIELKNRDTTLQICPMLVKSVRCQILT